VDFLFCTFAQKLTKPLLFFPSSADPKTELIDPAVIGTTSILKAIKRSAPGVKRVVITSSFASILDEATLEADPPVTYSEESWNPVTVEDIHRSKPTAYRASKKLAEKAAWDFVANEKPNFDLATVCPPMVLGPVVHHLKSLEAINTSNSRIVDLLRGKWKEEIPATGAAVIWIDVRDTALAHIRAIEKPEAGGRRLFTTAGYFSNRGILDAVRKNFPEYADRLPSPELEGGDIGPLEKLYKFDNSRTQEILGIQWIPLEQSITDLTKDLKALGV
jgi:nucleoside-diphosphate-sugar epimerase